MHIDSELYSEMFEDNLMIAHYLSIQQARTISILGNLVKQIKVTLKTDGTPEFKIERIEQEICRVEKDIFEKGRGSWNIVLGKTNFKMVCAGCGNIHSIEIHHIDENQKNNMIENLIPLCRNCHDNVHAGTLEITNEMWCLSRIST